MGHHWVWREVRIYKRQVGLGYHLKHLSPCAVAKSETTLQSLIMLLQMCNCVQLCFFSTLKPLLKASPDKLLLINDYMTNHLLPSHLNSW